MHFTAADKHMLGPVTYCVTVVMLISSPCSLAQSLADQLNRVSQSIMNMEPLLRQELEPGRSWGITCIVIKAEPVTLARESTLFSMR